MKIKWKILSPILMLLALFIFITLKKQADNRAVSTAYFSFKYPSNWVLKEKSMNKISIIKPDSQGKATDYIFETDYANLCIQLVSKKELNSLVITSADLKENTGPDSIQSIKKSSISKGTLNIPIIYWTSESTNGIDAFFPYDKNRYVLLKMIYGDIQKNHLEKEFYKTLSSFKKLP